MSCCCRPLPTSYPHNFVGLGTLRQRCVKCRSELLLFQKALPPHRPRRPHGPPDGLLYKLLMAKQSVDLIGILILAKNCGARWTGDAWKKYCWNNFFLCVQGYYLCDGAYCACSYCPSDKPYYADTGNDCSCWETCGWFSCPICCSYKCRRACAVSLNIDAFICVLVRSRMSIRSFAPEHMTPTWDDCWLLPNLDLWRLFGPEW